jgi:cation diffusion facilitator CzcD-associated flavoprotein CzcO
MGLADGSRRLLPGGVRSTGSGADRRSRREWGWAETQSEQSAVLEYLEHVADRFDLRRDIQFETWVEDARYDGAAQRWTVETSKGQRASAPFLICAVGALSTANMPDIPGIHDFSGECYHTGRWPH